MDRETDFEAELQLLTESVEELTGKADHDIQMILALLRTLEQLHQEIREGVFHRVLPKNRQELYHLLREIDSQGGWPYIPRQSLRSLLKYFDLKTSPEPNNKEVQ